MGAAWAIFVILWLLCGMLCAYIGQQKNRSVAGFFALGFFLGLIGIIIALVWPKMEQGFQGPPDLANVELSLVHDFQGGHYFPVFLGSNPAIFDKSFRPRQTMPSCLVTKDGNFVVVADGQTVFGTSLENISSIEISKTPSAPSVSWFPYDLGSLDDNDHFLLVAAFYNFYNITYTISLYYGRGPSAEGLIKHDKESLEGLIRKRKELLSQRQIEAGMGANIETQPEDLKKCPFCAELIKKDAIKCKHCGSMLEPAS